MTGDARFPSVLAAVGRSKAPLGWKGAYERAQEAIGGGALRTLASPGTSGVRWAAHVSGYVNQFVPGVAGPVTSGDCVVVMTDSTLVLAYRTGDPVVIGFDEITHVIPEPDGTMNFMVADRRWFNLSSHDAGVPQQALEALVQGVPGGVVCEASESGLPPVVRPAEPFERYPSIAAALRTGRTLETVVDAQNRLDSTEEVLFAAWGRCAVVPATGNELDTARLFDAVFAVTTARVLVESPRVGPFAPTRARTEAMWSTDARFGLLELAETDVLHGDALWGQHYVRASSKGTSLWLLANNSDAHRLQTILTTLIAEVNEWRATQGQTQTSGVRETPSPGSASNSSAEQRLKLLRELKAMVDDGILTQDEFEAQKAQILG